MSSRKTSKGEPAAFEKDMAVVAVNGVVTYTPNAGFIGADSFRYVAIDPLGGTDTTTVSVAVNTPRWRALHLA